MSGAAQVSQLAVTPAPPQTELPHSDLVSCLARLMAIAGCAVNRNALLAGLPYHHGEISPDLCLRAAQQQHLGASLVETPLNRLNPALLPVILLSGTRGIVLLSLHEHHARIANPAADSSDNDSIDVPLSTLQAWHDGRTLLLRIPERLRCQAASDDNDSDDIPAPQSGNASSTPPQNADWFWPTLWRFRRYYNETLLAAVLINLLTLASTFFTMNVYDRVVPHQTYSTLWVLAIGTAIASIVELILRWLRARFVDTAGKKADLLLGAALFRQALSIRAENRPASSGAFAHQLREFEVVRDFVTAATLGTLTDLPFTFLFLLVIGLIGGPLVILPMAVIPIIVIAGLLIQRPLIKLVRSNLADSARKYGLLNEALEGVETLRAHNAEGMMQKKWEDWSVETAHSNVQTREINSLMSNAIITTQQLLSIGIIIWGVYLIHEGKLSLGALIACVILAGRAVSPLGQVALLVVRFQSARAALRTLNHIMALPVDRDSSRRYLAMPNIKGQVQAEHLEFAFPGTGTVLHDIRFAIQPGEHVAILGKVGSGKTTLLRLIGGLLHPTKGHILIDSMDSEQIDPADKHRQLRMVTGDACLFRGSLRENLLLAAPHSSDEELLRIASLTGIDKLAAQHPKGYDMPIGERGEGLSSGQRQQVRLARALLGQPPVILLDEPTATLDTTTERQLINQLRPELQNRTLILVTHQMSLLEMVDRIIIIDQGRIVADGPKLQVLQALGVPA